ncbi:TPA: DUF3265 domain-containing protein [Vibrio vulnificus]|nr:DUF3265 domain-containing protein [Vibrio vulnificus]
MVVCIERAGKIHITRRSRGIHAAWHFWYAVVLVVKVVYGKLVYAAFTP